MAAGAEVLAVGGDGEAAGSPPMLHLRGIGPGVPDEADGGVVDAGDFYFVGLGFGGHGLGRLGVGFCWACTVFK